jgi:antitoxin component HigA of HigAB toxin-antitoxin module
MNSMATLDLELKKLEARQKGKNPFFVKLMNQIPPRPIEAPEEHSLFLEVLKKISLFLNEVDQESEKEPVMSDRTQAQQQIEAYRRYARIIEELIEHYEREKFPSKSDAREVLMFLMEQHGLVQKDLAKEFGGQANVSAVLSGKRQMNLQQIRRLAERFKISPLAFI